MVKRKKAKPATEAQKRARERNWNKGQMKCIIAIANKMKRSKTTHDKEKLGLSMIISAADGILQNWTNR